MLKIIKRFVRSKKDQDIPGKEQGSEDIIINIESCQNFYIKMML